MKRISKSAFKATALAVLREVEKTGQPVVITDRGRPVAEVRPVQRPQKMDPFEFLRGSVLRYDRPTDPVGEDDWEALREIE